MNIWLVNRTSSSTMDNALQLFGLILMFCFVLAATYLTSRFVGRSKLGQLRNKNFKVIETYKVAPNKFLQLIKMGSKYVVVSIGKDEVRFITELSEEDVLLPMDNEQQGMKFSDFIAKVHGKHMITKEIEDVVDIKEMNHSTKE